MHRRKTTHWAVGFVLVMVAAGQVFSQNRGAEQPDKPGAAAQPPAGMSPEDMAAMQEYLKLASPGPHHKHLEPFVGTWNTVTKTYMAGPDGPTMESTGSATFKWVLGGRYLMQEYKGEFMGMPYEGIGMTGYDNVKNLYVGSWASTMGTELLTMSGSRHPKTGAISFYGLMDEPALNVHGRTVKYVQRSVDPDTFVFEIYDLHAGDDYKVMEITYKRKK